MGSKPDGYQTNTSTLNAIAYGNDTFVVGAGDSPDGDKTKRFLTSTDGTNWFVQIWPNGNTRTVYGVAYGAGLFVAACERAEIWTSPNGTNWTQRVSPLSDSHRNLRAITYRPDLGFVAAGDSYSSGPGEIVTSPDGVTWALNTNGSPAPPAVPAIGPPSSWAAPSTLPASRAATSTSL